MEAAVSQFYFAYVQQVVKKTDHTISLLVSLSVRRTHKLLYVYGAYNTKITKI